MNLTTSTDGGNDHAAMICNSTFRGTSNAIQGQQKNSSSKEHDCDSAESKLSADTVDECSILSPLVSVEPKSNDSDNNTNQDNSKVKIDCDSVKDTGEDGGAVALANDSDLSIVMKQLQDTRLNDKSANNSHPSTVQTQKDPGPLAKSSNRDQQKMQLCLQNWVKILLEHMNKFGMCVFDNFLGETIGKKVFDEVRWLQDHHIFQDGQLMVMTQSGVKTPSIRNDKITWTDGITPCNSPALRSLIQLVDKIVLRANKVSNNGDLGKYRISGRTRVMVACYPGGGSHYVRHVDNPNRDGRVITAIYYLNQNWNPETDGGSLQIYPQINNGSVIKINPQFDRLVLFWSDSRNPHEVLPSNRPRYAVTVWYLDETEKTDYEQKRSQTPKPQQL